MPCSPSLKLCRIGTASIRDGKDRRGILVQRLEPRSRPGSSGDVRPGAVDHAAGGLSVSGRSSSRRTSRWLTSRTASGSTASASNASRSPPRRPGLAARRAAGDAGQRSPTSPASPSEVSDFLQSSAITETRAFVRSFVKAILVKPGRATIHYAIPTPKDSPIGGGDAAEVALSGRVMSTVRAGGPNLTVGSTAFELVVAL